MRACFVNTERWTGKSVHGGIRRDFLNSSDSEVDIYVGERVHAVNYRDWQVSGVCGCGRSCGLIVIRILVGGYCVL